MFIQTHALVTCESRQATVLPQSGIDEPEQFEPIERGSEYNASSHDYLLVGCR